MSSLLQAFKIAFTSLRYNKMRSFLTMLGIIIGVFAVTVLISLVQGTTSQVTSQIEGMGTNLLTVNIMRSRGVPISLDDFETLKQEPVIGDISPMVSGSGSTLKAGTTTYDEASVLGVAPSYMDIRLVKLADGRFINEYDMDFRNASCIIGNTVATKLFGRTDVVGETFKMDGREFTVVGVLEASGSTLTGSNDTQVFIPYTLAARMFKNTNISQFYVAAASSDSVSAAKSTLEKFLTQKTRGEDDYNIFDQTSMLDTLSSVTDSLAMLMGGIAGISLLVGGIGIMNIMLVSVSERTREIGIRKAVGAQRTNILGQFLIEAIVVSLLGGVLGLLLGYAAASILEKALSVSVPISATVVVIAVGFSTLIGVIFGLYPANKASKLKPIEALRYE